MSVLVPERRTLPGPGEILLAPRVMTEAEGVELLDWAVDRHRRGRLLTNPRDPLTHLTPFLAADGRLTAVARGDGTGPRPVWVPANAADLLESLPPAFWRIRDRVIDVFRLYGVPEDPYKGAFLSVIEPGGGVSAHRDARLTVAGRELLALRCNVLFHKPAGGGIPTIANLEIDVPELAAWLFYPSEQPHSASAVRAGDPGRLRGTLSFGFGVDPGLLAHRAFRLARDAPAAPDWLRALSARRTEFTAADFPSSHELRRLQRQGIVASLSGDLAGVAAVPI